MTIDETGLSWTSAGWEKTLKFTDDTKYYQEQNDKDNVLIVNLMNDKEGDKKEGLCAIVIMDGGIANTNILDNYIRHFNTPMQLHNPRTPRPEAWKVTLRPGQPTPSRVAQPPTPSTAPSWLARELARARSKGEYPH